MLLVLGALKVLVPNLSTDFIHTPLLLKGALTQLSPYRQLKSDEQAKAGEEYKRPSTIQKINLYILQVFS
jgi:hypothetical protein